MGKYILELGVGIVLLGLGFLGYTQYTTSTGLFAPIEQSPVSLLIKEKQEQKTFEKKSQKGKEKATEKKGEIGEKGETGKKGSQGLTLYVDFTCPYCHKFYKQSFAPLRKQYQTTIPFRVAHYPLQTNGLAIEIAKFYECAIAQKESWVVLDLLYFGYDTLDISQQNEWIEKLELKKEPLQQCMENEQTLQNILKERETGKSLGVRGTPTIFIGDKKFEGYNSLETLGMEIVKYKTR